MWIIFCRIQEDFPAPREYQQFQWKTIICGLYLFMFFLLNYYVINKKYLYTNVQFFCCFSKTGMGENPSANQGCTRWVYWYINLFPAERDKVLHLRVCP